MLTLLLAARTLVAVFAHPDDETSVAPMLARYAREGAQVYLITATDGAEGVRNTTIPRGEPLATARAQELRCATDALGIHPPILLGFPDAGLADNATLFRLTARLHEELQKLHPDSIVTWGPDGGTGHPDHRLVSSVVTQLVRNGAVGVPDRLFYATVPAEAFAALSPTGAAPPLLAPEPRHLGVRVPVTPADFDAGMRSLACHKSQYPEPAVQRLTEISKKVLAGSVALSRASGTPDGTDVFSGKATDPDTPRP
jgi:LmbE family N-acetylglucosaminyl deacetylase